MKRRLVFKILLVLYLIAVAWLCFGHFSSIPHVKMFYRGIPTDKIVHFLMFFPFPLLAFGAFDKYTTKPWHSFLFVAVLFALGCMLAGATEIGQTYTKYRRPEGLQGRRTRPRNQLSDRPRHRPGQTM